MQRQVDPELSMHQLLVVYNDYRMRTQQSGWNVNQLTTCSVIQPLQEGIEHCMGTTSINQTISSCLGVVGSSGGTGQEQQKDRSLFAKTLLCQCSFEEWYEHTFAGKEHWQFGPLHRTELQSCSD